MQFPSIPSFLVVHSFQEFSGTIPFRSPYAPAPKVDAERHHSPGIIRGIGSPKPTPVPICTCHVKRGIVSQIYIHLSYPSLGT